MEPDWTTLWSIDVSLEPLGVAKYVGTSADVQNLVVY
jgi:hypothetical protein